MNKIASPKDLVTELNGILAKANGPAPSRAVLAQDLNDLANRLAALSDWRPMFRNWMESFRRKNGPKELEPLIESAYEAVAKAHCMYGDAKYLNPALWDDVPDMYLRAQQALMAIIRSDIASDELKEEFQKIWKVCLDRRQESKAKR